MQRDPHGADVVAGGAQRRCLAELVEAVPAGAGAASARRRSARRTPSRRRCRRPGGRPGRRSGRRRSGCSEGRCGTRVSRTRERPLSRMHDVHLVGPVAPPRHGGGRRSATRSDVIFWPVPDRIRSGSRVPRSASTGHDPLHPHHRDVHARQARAHAAVALVLDEHERPGLGDAEVHARDRRPARAGSARAGGRGRRRSGRRDRRRSAWPASGSSSSRTSARLLWIAGMMMCSGASPAVWTMNSPRSVSITSTPAAARRSFRPISSDAIDLPLTTSPPVPQHDLRDVGGRVRARRPPGARWRRFAPDCACSWSSSAGRSAMASARMRSPSARSASKSIASIAAVRLSCARSREAAHVLDAAPRSASAARRPAVEAAHSASARIDRQVHHPHGHAGAGRPSLDVHDAAGVGADDGVGARRPAPTPACRRPSPSRRPGSAPRTCRRSRSSDRPRQLAQVAHGAQQPPRRLVHAQLAQHVAGVVVGDGPVQRRPDPFGAAQLLDQVLRELEHARARPCAARACVAVAAEQAAPVQPHHRRARAGRHHDRVQVGHRAQRAPRHPAGVGDKAAVPGRLAAAGRTRGPAPARRPRRAAPGPRRAPPADGRHRPGRWGKARSSRS